MNCPTCTAVNTSGYQFHAAYPQNSTVTTKRIVLVPRGNLEFDMTVISAVPVPTAHSGRANKPAHAELAYTVTVTATGVNPGVAAQPRSLSGVLQGFQSAKLRIPINVDWAESVVTIEASFGLDVCDEGYFNPKLGDLIQQCSGRMFGTKGQDLSSIALGASFPFSFPNNAFLVVATPAAAFTLPVLPVAILYGPLGNAGKSSYTISAVTGSNQQFTNSKGQTFGFSQDDKTSYSDGISLSLGKSADAFGGKFDAGITFGGSSGTSKDHSSTETHGTTTSVVTQDQISTQYSIGPFKDQPPLDHVTFGTQPYWKDVILAAIDARYAIWDYPAGPVIQPWSNAEVAELPVLQLDACYRSPDMLKPASLTPATWQKQPRVCGGDHDSRQRCEREQPRDPGGDEGGHERGRSPGLERQQRRTDHRRPGDLDQRTAALHRLRRSGGKRQDAVSMVNVAAVL